MKTTHALHVDQCRLGEIIQRTETTICVRIVDEVLLALGSWQLTGEVVTWQRVECCEFFDQVSSVERLAKLTRHRRAYS